MLAPPTPGARGDHTGFELNDSRFLWAILCDILIDGINNNINIPRRTVAIPSKSPEAGPRYRWYDIYDIITAVAPATVTDWSHPSFLQFNWTSIKTLPDDDRGRPGRASAVLVAGTGCYIGSKTHFINSSRPDQLRL